MFTTVAYRNRAYAPITLPQCRPFHACADAPVAVHHELVPPPTRQDELERAASAASVSWAATSATGGNSKSTRDVVALALEYQGVDVWAVAAAAATALLGPGYAKLRSKGLTAPSSAARIDAELRSGGGGGGDDDGDTGAAQTADKGGDGGSLLRTLLDGGRGGQGALELARAAFIGAAEGQDLHHLDLLLRLMSEAAARSGVSGGDPGSAAAGGGKNPVERRLNAHCGLVRRLLKAAPPGLDYKALVGDDPLADPLADPRDYASSAPGGTPPAPSSTGSSSSNSSRRRTRAGLAAARARAMTELRSVAGLEHAPALSKLAARMPGMSGSAVYLAVAQRMLCGETGGLSPEALELLRGGNVGGGRGEEAEAASASVYHLLSPLLQKMTAEDLVEVTAAVCAPHAAGAKVGLGHYPCRRRSPAVGPSSTAGLLTPDRMEPLHLTVRCRRRVLAATSAAIITQSGGSAASDEGTAAAGTAAAVAATSSPEGKVARLTGLLDALAAVPTAAAAIGRALEMAWATANGAHRDAAEVSLVSPLERAIAAAAGAAVELALAGTTPAAVGTVCSSMRGALGVPSSTAGAEGPASAAIPAGEGTGEERGSGTESLSLSGVYSTATRNILARSVARDPEGRARALEDLRVVCAAVGPGGDGGMGGGGGEVAAAKVKAWGVLAPALDLFCREGDLGLEGTERGGAAPSVVLWARAEVLTVLRPFSVDGHGTASGNDSGDDPSAEGCAVDGGGGSGTRTDTGEVDGALGGSVSTQQDGEGDEHEQGCAAAETGSDRADSGDADGGTGRRRSPSPPSAPQMSVSFLRVAELAMEAFGVRVSSGDVEGWEARSVLVGTLVSAAAATTTGFSVDGEDNPIAPGAKVEARSRGGRACRVREQRA